MPCWTPLPSGAITTDTQLGQHLFLPSAHRSAFLVRLVVESKDVQDAMDCQEGQLAFPRVAGLIRLTLEPLDGDDDVAEMEWGLRWKNEEVLDDSLAWSNLQGGETENVRRFIESAPRRVDLPHVVIGHKDDVEGRGQFPAVAFECALGNEAHQLGVDPAAKTARHDHFDGHRRGRALWPTGATRSSPWRSPFSSGYRLPR